VTDDGLSAGAVARRLGVAVTTLRTWHQRYGLGPSRHVPGRHRRYTDEDLARLEVMRRLTAQGVPPAEAARWASRPALPAPSAAGAFGRGDGATGPATAVPADGSGEAGAVPSARVPGRDHAAPRARHGGGNAIPVGRSTPAARGLARAAVRLDGPTMRDLLQRSVDARGVVGTWEAMVAPVLIGIGTRHANTAAMVEVEHLVSRTVTEVFGAVPRPPVGGPPPAILLACADEEQHSLPLEALAAALAEAGVPCRLLGARVPPGALRDAITRTGPRVVVLWAQQPQTADPDQLNAVLTAPNRPMLLVAAGPGWHREDVPDEVVVPATLAQALTITAGSIDFPAR
jgi:hypothetical protein